MIRFGSRGSDLALTQTRLVANALQELTGAEFSTEVIETRGDRNIETPIADIGGKGLFTSELESALREHRIDVAVHSLKDLPVEDPEGLTIGAIPAREAPHDVLLFDPEVRDPEGGTVPLLGGCSIGTSSPRRRSSLLTLRPDLECMDIRGNVGTRARKVAAGDYDATILAAAGLSRLALDTPDLERCDLPTDLFTPAPGQGALGVQCRSDDSRMLDALGAIHDETTALCVTAERDLLYRLGGGCSMPLGALVTRDGAGFRMQVSLFSENQPTCGITFEVRDDQPGRLAVRAAEEIRPLLGEPLAGQSVVLLRPGGSGGRLGRALGFAGADVELVPVSEVLPLSDGATQLAPDDLETIAFTSVRAVDRFFEQAVASGLDVASSAFFAGGPATAEAVRRRGLECEEPTDGAGGLVLAAWIQGRRAPGDGTILFPCAENRHGDFETTMRNAGYTVTAVPVYRTVIVPGVEIPAADHIVFTSPSAVRAYAAGEPAIEHASLLALGDTTAGAMVSVGMTPRGVATAPTANALVHLIMGIQS